ncbi:phosphonate transport system substrate-binding protein [Mesorhizobium sp. J18]|uniref:phosphate/phosphite/phosphonate ABC transporter substrate-binding protein n=1 Tax=Mesorhizobium sp. J18 TaxID=935263 RepID=UPI00119BB6BD|nr:phosphate/phosphite/phosphonate ABC transporter substrate-binding protein [Mesorhizobium sp. J18]TWG97480.1 phosphonate transport system substrate-binding protein [Mesorhizobium sp. J18]
MLRTMIAGLALMATTLVANAAETVRFAVTDIEGLEALQQEFGPFRDTLEEVTGFQVEFFPVNSRTAAVEALTSDQVDFVLTGPAEYVVMKQLTDAKIVTAWQRPDYYAQVVVLADGPIKSVQDLKGKTVAFGSVGSTSQHLGPAQTLTDLGLKYGTDYEAQIIGRNVAVEALINGDIAAIGMNADHLQSAREAYPEVAFTVLARGRDLPNDVLVARPDVSEDVFNTMRDAFVNEGKKLMASVITDGDNRKYEGGFFITSVDDSSYDYVRSMYRTIGVDSFDAFVGN